MARINGKDNLNDLLVGTRNGDIIDGKDKRDVISAGDGNDVITGGLGNDFLTGGEGADRFYFGHLHDADVILDFGPNDKIDLDASIDRYFVTKVWNGIRIATVDDDHTADPVQGSIVLSGVTIEEWKSWGGAYGSASGYDANGISSGTLII
jgi:Ca2+-binding RTX toxin-like protein